MQKLNNNAYKILTFVGDKKNNIGLSAARGTSKEYIVERSGFSLSTVNRAIPLLLENGFIDNAIMQVSKKTYYITQKGLDEIRAMNNLTKTNK